MKMKDNVSETPHKNVQQCNRGKRLNVRVRTVAEAASLLALLGVTILPK